MQETARSRREEASRSRPIPSRRDNRRRTSRFASGLSVLLALSLASPADAAAPRAGELISADEPYEVYLDVEINDRPTGLIAAFEQHPDGRLWAARSELEEIGIQPDPAIVGADGMVELGQIDGLSYEYDEPSQRLLISADLDTLATRRIRPRGAPSVPELSEPIWSAFANYNVFASGGRDHENGIRVFDGVSLATDAYLSGPYGVLSSGAIAGFFDSREERLIRLDTTYTYSDPDRLVRYHAGDLISGGLSWTRPVRLGGIQVERDFALRPDLITRPLPSFSGTAEVPSTLEVYSNNVRVFSGEIEPGPFELDEIPVVTDAGAAQVVLVDAQGRTVLAELPFFTSTDLLRPGMLSFSAEVGWPRRSFGVDSFDYSSEPFGSATARYGITDRLTAEAHTEIGDSLLNAGAGAAFSFDQWLLASAHIAASESDVGSGAQIGGSMQLDIGPARFSGRSIRRFGDFWDIAAASAAESGGARNGLTAAPATAIDQLSVSTRFSFDPTRLSLSYTRRKRADDSSTSIGSISASRRLWREASLHLSGFKDFEDTSNFGVFASVSFPMGGQRRGQTGIRTGPDGITGFADIYRNLVREPGETGWRFRAVSGDEDRIGAEARHWASFGQLRAAVDLDADRAQAQADLDGAVVVGGGGLHFANRIYDSFAIADAGAEDVQVFYQNRPAGRTGADGRLVVPRLRSYESNGISIEPMDLPLDLIVETDSREVAPPSRSGVYVKFGAEREDTAAIVVLVNPSGAYIPVGSEVRRSGHDEPALVGYDGEVYLRNLDQHEVLDVRVSGGTRCKAPVRYPRSSSVQTRLEGVVCE